MKKINPSSLRQLRKRIKKLSLLNLSKYNKDTVSKFINNSFKIPYNTWIQKSGHIIYRSCINDNENPFEKISRIAYNPDPDYIERANLKGKGTGYGAGSLNISAIENCQYELRNGKRRTFYLTIGAWIPTRDLNVIVICHSKRARKVGTDLRDAYYSLLKKQAGSRKDKRVWNLKNKFFAEQFAKEKFKHENDYLFSALFSNTVFKSEDPIIDAIWYPSVAYRLKGFNIAYKPSLVDNKELIIKKVFYVKIQFKSNYRSFPTISIISESSTFEGDMIIWSTYLKSYLIALS